MIFTEYTSQFYQSLGLLPAFTSFSFNYPYFLSTLHQFTKST